VNSGSFVVYQSFYYYFQSAVIYEIEERIGVIMSHRVGFCIGY
jgi:hypothetical protein